MASRYEVEVTISSAKDLQNVSCRHGPLKPYAVVWVDPKSKCSTLIDEGGDTCPPWNQTLVIPFNDPIEDSTLHVDIVQANADEDTKPLIGLAPLPLRNTKPLIGSARFPLREVVYEFGLGGEPAQRKLDLKHPSGGLHGKLEIKVSVREQRYRASEPNYPPSIGHPAPTTRDYYTAPRPYGNPYAAAPPYDNPYVAPPPVGYYSGAPYGQPNGYAQSAAPATGDYYAATPPYGNPYAAPPPNPYAAPPPYGNPYATPPPMGYSPASRDAAPPPVGYSPASRDYYAAPPPYGNPYAAPPPYGNPYAAPPPYGNPYAAPPPYGNPYAAPPPYFNPYAAPPPYFNPYAVPPPYFNPYAAPPTVGYCSGAPYGQHAGYAPYAGYGPEEEGKKKSKSGQYTEEEGKKKSGWELGWDFLLNVFKKFMLTCKLVINFCKYNENI